MRVRDEILVSHPANGGLDVPLVFELEQEECGIVADYLRSCLGSFSVKLLECAWRLAERGIPQAIEQLVIDELLAQGRSNSARAVMMDPFPCPRSKVAT